MRLFRRIVLALLALAMVLGLFVPAVEAAPASGALSFRQAFEEIPPTQPLIVERSGTTELPLADDTGTQLRVSDEVLLSGADVTCVGLAGAPDDMPAVGPNVRLVFDGSQKQRLTEITTAHVGDKIAIVLNGKVLMAPVLQDPITGGEVVVYGEQGWDARALRDTIHRDAGVALCPE